MQIKCLQTTGDETLNQAHTQAEHVDSIAASTFWRRGEIGKNTEDVWWRRTVSSGWPQDSLCAYFKAVKQPQGEHDNKEIKSLLGNELGWQKRADDITLCFLCLRAGGWLPRPNPDECASLRPPPKTSFCLVGGCGKVSATLVWEQRELVTHWSFITHGVTRINVPFQARFMLCRDFTG